MSGPNGVTHHKLAVQCGEILDRHFPVDTASAMRGLSLADCDKADTPAKLLKLMAKALDG